MNAHALTLPPIDDLHDEGLTTRVQTALDQKTKPRGALGRLESLALKLAQIQGRDLPALEHPQMVVFAGDHGLAARGVSAFPSDVTWQMVENFLAGGAAVSVLARQHGLALTVVDAGVKHAFAPRPGLLARKIGWGTADALEGPAMTPAECIAAVETGAGVVRSLPGNVVLFGEMGIGNTSSASLLMARLTGEAIDRCTGRGTGVDGPALVRKTEILRKVLARHEAATAPLDVLAAFGGFEIAMLVGAVLEAAAQRRVIVVDGFIVSAAVLVAARLHPNVLQRCVFAHQSDESGHRLMLARLEAEPLLSLGLRLGEGSGAALAWPLLDSACRILAEMASFASAGVSDRAD
ncbi:nicotinate-nucleotide--dimethylbenzimidazole phosphoribosyltransferase [Sphaerotilus sp.]|uniref:nicotinate-nucleotide--dimethylbenzimidazole phosphoribosyltransferase n=1 Tax=Sphaerotilus sp. TaxID=2093942 RepID=UPI0025F7C7B7|nr:nicotinate-nucleotide--dimethylbenzimidazole phosphoribosyltransferase [Sphaerotilus sp.]